MSWPGGQPAPGALPTGQGPAELAAEVRRVLDACLPEAAGVVIAVSGGPDSTALAALTRRARADLHAQVAHVRHGLRDDAADAAAAAETATALGMAFHECRVRVSDTGEGVAAAARRARYRALARVAAEAGATAVLTGHTADDQAETVVLNLARGTGLAGLAGMETVTGRDTPKGAGADRGGPVLVRPLLRLRRADVHAFIAEVGLATVADPSNRDRARRRVRAREEALPALARLSGGVGDPVGALTRLADLARGDAEALDALAAQHADRLVAVWGPGRALQTAALAELPAALATRVLRRMLSVLVGETAAGGQSAPVDAATVERVMALAPGQGCHIAHGVWVTHGNGWLAAVTPAATLTGRRVELPGTTPVAELDAAVQAETVTAPATGDPARDADAQSRRPPGTRGSVVATLPLEGELWLRACRRGDRLGGRALGRLLGRAGVPRALRGLVPVVVAADDTPRWVPGVGQACDPPARGPAVRLRLAPLR